MKILLTVLFALSISTISIAEQKPSKQIPYLKPGAPIRVTSPEFIQLEPYSEQSIIVELATPETGTLIITPKAETGIAIKDKQEELKYTLNGNQTTKIELVLSAEEAGQYNLMFHAKLDNGGQSSFRVFGVAVYVGEQQNTLSQKSYPKHIVMPAKESVH